MKPRQDRRSREYIMKQQETTRRDLRPLTSIHIAPYMQVATALIGKAREGGGNMFRHQVDTMSVLIDYGYIDSILLKAALIHDVIEDIDDFNVNDILSIDSEAGQVYNLVLEVTKKKGQKKPDYLKGIIKHGSEKAKILKCADRISNMVSLGFVNEPEFIERYCDETEVYVFPIALAVNFNMYEELLHLVMSRRKYLSDSGYLLRDTKCEHADSFR